MLSSHLGPRVQLGTHTDGDPARIFIGERVDWPFSFIQAPFFAANSGSIWVDDDTFFGFGVKLLAGTHDYTKRGPARRAHPQDGCDIRIGKGVWLASDVTVCGPATLGDYAAVGVGSLVMCDIPAGELWVGRPARFLKKINSPTEDAL